MSCTWHSKTPAINDTGGPRLTCRSFSPSQCWEWQIIQLLQKALTSSGLRIFLIHLLSNWICSRLLKRDTIPWDLSLFIKVEIYSIQVEVDLKLCVDLYLFGPMWFTFWRRGSKATQTYTCLTSTNGSAIHGCFSESPLLISPHSPEPSPTYPNPTYSMYDTYAIYYLIIKLWIKL